MVLASIDPNYPKVLRGHSATVVDSGNNPRDRVEAIAALGRYGGNPAGFVDLLVTALDSDDDRLVAEAATSLGMTGVASDVVLARLHALTQDERANVAKRGRVTATVTQKWWHPRLGEGGRRSGPS